MKRSFWLPLASLTVIFLSGFSSLAQSGILISEWMADNRSVIADEDGQYSDWIEIHNPTAISEDLDGYYLTDDPGLLTKWVFPSLALQPNGYLVVFASGKDRRDPNGELHTNFQLNNGGEFLALVMPDGVTLVNVFSPSFPPLKEDVAYGVSQKPTTTELIAASAPQILVPANAAELPADWNTLDYEPGANWLAGAAPAQIGYDLSQASGALVNLARTGSPAPAATQSTSNTSYPAGNAIDDNLGNFTHTLNTDVNPHWMVSLQRRAQIQSITIHNRDSCCGSRLRDITVQIFDEDGSTLRFTSALLNPENTGYAFPAGPDNLVIDLSSQPVLGQYVKVIRTPDHDLSGTGGQGNVDEATVLSLGEVIVIGTDIISYHPFITTGLEDQMLGKNASAFVRLPFAVNDASAMDVLTFSTRYDDGFILYLNGVKVAERNAPAVPAWDSTALIDRAIEEGMTLETINLNSALPQLVTGLNVLAIQAMNSSANDDNFLFQPQLTAQDLSVSDYAYLETATPGRINDTDFYLGEVADTQFDVDRGFFEAPFSLSITSATPDAVIYYSLNGDEPGPTKGEVYNGPITITNTTILRARAFKDFFKPTDVDTHTYLFLADVLHQSPSGEPPPNFPSSWGKNRVNYGMDPLIIAQYTDEEWQEALTQIPTMSIVTEMGNLFDPATGIYANADGHGIGWERPSSLELLDPHGAPASKFQENCGLRIRGGYSRNPQFVKHSLRVFFRREYGAPKLKYPMFEDDGADEFDTLDLRTSQNYSWPREGNPGGTHETLVRDLFCRETLGALGQPYTRSRYYHLYLNGQYWGIYMTQERAEASYGETYFGGNKEDYDVPKCANHIGGFVTEATDGDLVAWSNLWSKCLSLPANPNNANYFEILGRNADGTRNPALPVLLEVDNLIDYMLEIFYSGDGDATLSSFLSNNRPNNWFSMRNRNDPNQGFRFFNQDSEHTLGAPNWGADRTGPWGGSNQGNFDYSNPQWFHEELMSNPEYRLRFADRVQRHFFNGGALTPEAGTNRFLTRAAQIDKAIRSYAARWGDANEAGYRHNIAEWQTEINWIVNNWFPGRTATVLQQLINDSLYPAVSAPDFSQLGGAVNPGSALSLSHGNASGTIYYTLDGSDPRLVGGAINPMAMLYTNPVVLTVSTRVKARIKSGSVWSALTEADFIVPGEVPLRITEIMYHPAPLTAEEITAGFQHAYEFEFLELRNIGSGVVNLGGICFDDGIAFAFTEGALAPGERILVVNNLAAFNFRYGPAANIAGTYTGRLDDAGERLELVDSGGQRILELSYADGWHPITDGFGFSLVSVDDLAPPALWNSQANWRPSSAAGGSPGESNPPAPGFPLVFINEVISRPVSPGIASVELVNLGSAPADIGGWWLTDDFAVPHKFQIPTNTTMPAGGFVSFTENDFGLAALGANALDLNLAGGELRLFSAGVSGELTGYYQGWDFGPAEEGVSFGRHVTSTGADHLVAQTETSLLASNAGPRIGPVVITEVMYRPPNLGPNDNSRDEYIELLNISDGPVALFDPLAPTNTWRISGNVDFTFPPNLTLAAGEYALVVNFNPAADPGLVAFFRQVYSVPSEVGIYGPYDNSLDNSGQSVELKRPLLLPTGFPVWAMVDKLSYQDSSPWPGGADGFGLSLQRPLPAAYGNDPAHWAAAFPSAGGGTVLTGEAPAITQHPAGQVLPTGSDLTLTVSATGTTPLFYQWRIGGSNIGGATNSTLQLTSMQPGQSGKYRVLVYNSGGSRLSDPAEIIVLLPPQIVGHPQSLEAWPGTNVTFSAAIGNADPVQYQWRLNGVDLIGETNAVLNVENVQLEDDGFYAVVVTGSGGIIESDPARLYVMIAPKIVSAPASQTVVEGSDITLSITITGNPEPFMYLLRRGSTPLISLLRNDHTGYFTLTNVQAGEGGLHRIIVTNAALTFLRENATFTLTVLADTDRDGLPDEWEIAQGLNWENPADANEDTDGDGLTDREEYQAGTERANALSYLKVEGMVGAAEGNHIEFYAVSNRTYSVLYKHALDETSWFVLENIPAHTTNRVATVTDSSPVKPTRYYRLVTPAQP